MAEEERMERKEEGRGERDCSICCSHFIMQSKKLPYFRSDPDRL